MEIQVCIGSACHKRGSYHIQKRLQELVEHHGVQDGVHVGVAFCLGQCENGITVQFGDRLVMGVCRDNVEEMFARYVLHRGQ